MDPRKLTAAALATALITVACAKKEEPADQAAAEPAAPAVDLAAEEQAIRNRSGEWMNYANSKDVASITDKLFASDAVLFSDDKAYRGPGIRAKYEADVKENPDALFSWTSDQVRVASSGDMAVEIGSYNFDPDGAGKKPAVQGSFVTNWVKSDGEWRVLADAGGENEAATP
jgi:ketosteroid isomerase-like protein